MATEDDLRRWNTCQCQHASHHIPARPASPPTLPTNVNVWGLQCGSLFDSAWIWQLAWLRVAQEQRDKWSCTSLRLRSLNRWLHFGFGLREAAIELGPSFQDAGPPSPASICASVWLQKRPCGWINVASALVWPITAPDREPLVLCCVLNIIHRIMRAKSSSSSDGPVQHTHTPTYTHTHNANCCPSNYRQSTIVAWILENWKKKKL